jgi:dTDP-4-amino-4,6-dideoxygalactose transaminase
VGSAAAPGRRPEALAIEGGPPAHPGPWPAWPQPSPEDEAAVLEVLRAGTWCAAARGEPVVRAFEEAFAALHAPGPAAPPSPLSAGPLRAVAVSNGTDALILALEAAGVGPGAEVIVPPYTFVATAAAALVLGAVPVFADVDPQTLCLDPEAVRRAWSPRTVAVVPVHFAGCPADMGALSALCAERGAALVEDACQAPGAAWAGRPVGAWGTFGCFSFQESKNLSAGEGGAVTGGGPGLDDVWSLHNAGRVRGGAWYGHPRVGRNARLTAFQAALLLSQLGRHEQLARRREAGAAALAAALEDVPGIRPLLPPPGCTRHAWHLFPFRYRAAAFGGHDRAEFLRALAAEGVPASAGYPLLSANPALRRRAEANAALGGLPPPGEGALPVAAAAAEECCWLAQNCLLAEEGDLRAAAAAMAKIRRAWT